MKQAGFEMETSVRGYENGKLCSLPVDEFAIKYHKITMEEMKPFMTSEYANVHTYDILQAILAERGEVRS